MDRRVGQRADGLRLAGAQGRGHQTAQERSRSRGVLGATPVAGSDRRRGVIRTAHQRSRFHVARSPFVALAAELVEFLGRDVAHDRQMPGRGPQILSERQNVHRVRAGRASQPALPRCSRPAPASGRTWWGCRAHTAWRRPAVERAFVARAQADLAVSRGTVSVLWLRRPAPLRGRCPWRRLPWKSGIRTSTPQPGMRSRMARMVSANSSAPPSLRSSRLTLVITAKLQPHGGHGFGYAARLVVIDRQRSAFLHRAKAAAPGADVAQDHERGGAVVPALAHVGTGGAFANRVQPQRPMRS